LPDILQAEKIITHNGNPTSKVLPSSNPKQHDLLEVKTKEVEKTPKILSKDTTVIDSSLPGMNLQETFAMF
jgi:hypothetical protein